MNVNSILIAFLAGLAAAAMTASVASLSAASVVLFYLAPLPLLIIGFTSGPLGAAIAGVSSSVVLGLLMGLRPGVFFLLSTAIAPVVISHFALLRRPQSEGPPVEGELRVDGQEWYPEGRLLLWCAGFAAALIIFSILATGPDAESFRAMVRSTATSMMQLDSASMTEAERAQAMNVINVMVSILPMLSASLWLFTLYVNLRIAAAVLQAAGKSGRPFAPFGQMRFPRMAALALAGSLALSAVPGTLGLFGMVAAAALVSAFMLLGLSVIHGLIQTHQAKGALLFALYFALSVLNWVLALPLAGLGLADLYLDMRARKGALATSSSNDPSSKE